MNITANEMNMTKEMNIEERNRGGDGEAENGKRAENGNKIS